VELEIGELLAGRAVVGGRKRRGQDAGENIAEKTMVGGCGGSAQGNA
jgi:hypothetical protein